VREFDSGVPEFRCETRTFQMEVVPGSSSFENELIGRRAEMERGTRRKMKDGEQNEGPNREARDDGTDHDLLPERRLRLSPSRSLITRTAEMSLSI
jgi:hypothetical protein